MNYIRSSVILLAVILCLVACDTKEEPAKPILSPVLQISGVNSSNPLSIDITMVVSYYGNQPVKEVGIVWSETSPVTVQNNRVVLDHNGKPSQYKTRIDELKPNEAYFVRAYIVDKDNTITYSAEFPTATMLHTIKEVTPLSVSADMEVTITGSGFEQNIVNLLVNDVKVNATVVDAKTIKFLTPVGLQTDSISVAVEIGSIKQSFEKKLKYLRGTWVKMKSLSNETASGFVYTIGLNNGYSAYVYNSKPYGTNMDSLYRYDPSSNTWSSILKLPVLWFSPAFMLHGQLFLIHRGLIIYNLVTPDYLELGPIPILNWSNPSGNGISLVSNGSAYIGLGLQDYKVYIKEMWKYNIAGNSWLRVNDFPGIANRACLAISAEQEFYVIGGSEALPDGKRNPSKEMWKYNTVMNTWEQKAKYPGLGYEYLSGLFKNEKLYVGGGGIIGSETTYNDFWEYDPSTDKWSKVVSIPVSRKHMYAFNLNGLTFMGGGANSDTNYFDLWKFEIQ